MLKPFGMSTATDLAPGLGSYCDGCLARNIGDRWLRCGCAWGAYLAGMLADYGLVFGGRWRGLDLVACGDGGTNQSK